MYTCVLQFIYTGMNKNNHQSTGRLSHKGCSAVLSYVRPPPRSCVIYIYIYIRDFIINCGNIHYTLGIRKGNILGWFA